MLESGDRKEMKKISTLHPFVVIAVISLCIYGLFVITFISLPRINPEFQRYGYWRESLIIPFYALLGLLITTRRPGHPIGWLFTLAGFAMALQASAGQYAEISLRFDNDGLPAGEWAAWISDMSQITTLSTIILLLMLFPTGFLPSRWWRPIAWSLIAGITIIMVFRAFFAGEMENYPLENPAGIPMLSGILSTAIDVGMPLLYLGLGGTVVMIVFRVIQSRGIERQQIKWFAFSVFILISMFFVIGYLDNALQDKVLGVLFDFIGSWLWTIVPIGLVVSTALAILRYRLFDIDIIIRKTLQYTVLTGLLVLVYFGSVVLLQSLFEILTRQGSPIVIVISTLAIAALFNPLRQRVQGFIDRRFFRRKYNAEQTLANFARVARDEVDVEVLSSAMLNVVEETMRPERVSLWLRKVRVK